MGRRKIEIKYIKDDRNRSVTFLKRKSGLFKKAHELGVLCNVEIVVLVYGNNKKLYEYCSGDTNDAIDRFRYFNGARERKGPDDFAGKGGGASDDDEDVDTGSPPRDDHTPPEPAPAQQDQPRRFHRMRGATPSASPPLPNGPNFAQQRRSPQPPTVTRPESRNDAPRRLSSMAPDELRPPQAQMSVPPYSYGGHAQHPQSNPQPFSHRPYNPHEQSHSNPPPFPPHHHHPEAHPMPRQASYAEPYLRVHQDYEHDPRRQSHPGGYPASQHQQQHTLQQQFQPPHLQHPLQHQHDVPPPHPSPQPHLHPNHVHAQSERLSPQPPDSGPSPRRPSPVPSKSHSIFTPIDESRSVLAQHWTQSAGTDPQSNERHSPRSHSIDIAALARVKAGSVSPELPSSSNSHTHAVPPPLQVPRSISLASLPSATFGSVPNTARSSTFGSETRRPRLTVKIPNETSEAEDNTAGTSAQDTSLTSSVTNQPAKNVVLPPPSPSAGNPLLSAGATGPPNPFARPAPPSHNSHNNNNKELETPLSALPSRVMEGNMLPSPSDLWATMFSRSKMDDNVMPSPLNFGATPTVANGNGFRDDIGEDRKRKADDDEDTGSEKRAKVDED